MFFEIVKKSPPYIWATFVRKFMTDNFRKSPNLVTLAGSVDTVKLSIDVTLDHPAHTKTPKMTVFTFRQKLLKFRPH